MKNFARVREAGKLTRQTGGLRFDADRALLSMPIPNLSEIGRDAADVLSMEEEVCGDWRFGIATFETRRGRESEVEATGGGPIAGQAHAAGDRSKKALRPARMRELAKEWGLDSANCTTM